MPIIQSKDEFNDFGPMLSRYRAALARLQSWGVRIAANSRLRMYAARLETADRVTPGLVSVEFAVQLAVDLREVDEVISIVASFDAEPTSAELELLRKLAGGAEHPDDERGSASREAQFELMMMVFLGTRGLDVCVGDPDLTITFDGKQYPLEAKRPGSAARFDDRLREAAAQIAARQTPGVVAMSMDEVLRPRGTYLRIKDRRLLATAVNALIVEYVAKHLRAMSLTAYRVSAAVASNASLLLQCQPQAGNGFFGSRLMGPAVGLLVLSLN